MNIQKSYEFFKAFGSVNKNFVTYLTFPASNTCNRVVLVEMYWTLSERGIWGCRLNSGLEEGELAMRRRTSIISTAYRRTNLEGPSQIY